MFKFDVCRRLSPAAGLIEDDFPDVLPGVITPSGPDDGGTGASGNEPAGAAEQVKPVPGATAPKTTDFNEADYIKKTFGDEYDSPDKIKTAVQRAKDLETEVTTLKSADPFSFIKDDYMRGLVKATNDGVSREAYDRVASVDPDKLSEQDAMVIHYQWKYGYKKEDAEFLVNEKYKLDPSLNAEDREVRIARLGLKADANEAMGWIRSHKAESLTPPAVEESKVAAEKMEKLTPVVSKLADSLKSFKWDEKDANPIEFPADVRKAATDHVLNAISGLEIDVTNKEQLREIAEEVQLQMIRNFGVKKVIGHYMAAMKVKELKDNNNSSALKDSPPSNLTKKQIEDQKVISKQIYEDY